MTAPFLGDTPARIDRARQDGRIDDKERDHFYYVWRDATFRFSDLGKREARRYAKANGLRLPSSDRRVVKGESEARAENYRAYQRDLPAWARGPG